MSNGIDGDFVALVRQFVHHGVIGKLMGHKKCAMNGTAIGIFVLAGKDSLLVQLPVVVVDRIVKGDVNELGNVFGI